MLYSPTKLFLIRFIWLCKTKWILLPSAENKTCVALIPHISNEGVVAMQSNRFFYRWICKCEKRNFSSIFVSLFVLCGFRFVIIAATVFKRKLTNHKIKEAKRIATILLFKSMIFMCSTALFLSEKVNVMQCQTPNNRFDKKSRASAANQNVCPQKWLRQLFSRRHRFGFDTRRWNILTLKQKDVTCVECIAFACDHLNFVCYSSVKWSRSFLCWVEKRCARQDEICHFSTFGWKRESILVNLWRLKCRASHRCRRQLIFVILCAWPVGGSKHIWCGRSQNEPTRKKKFSCISSSLNGKEKKITEDKVRRSETVWTKGSLRICFEQLSSFFSRLLCVEKIFFTFSFLLAFPKPKKRTEICMRKNSRWRAPSKRMNERF